MIEKKICMLGAFAVGKTSLVRRFVTRLFSEHYHTTIGVTVDKKSMTVDGEAVTLVLWDLYGEDDFQKLRPSYLRGSSDYVLVLDGVRRATLDIALQIQQTAAEALGPVPFVVIINKCDRVPDWEITDQDLAQLAQRGWTFVMGSAKTGQGVEEALTTLARALLLKPDASSHSGETHGS